MSRGAVYSKSQTPGVLDNFNCPVCQNVAVNPVQCSAGHTGCADCMEKCKTAEKPYKYKCPVCRVESTAHFSVNLCVRQLADITTISCLNKGCQKKFLVSEHRKHELECPFVARPCENQKNGCETVDTQKNLDKHRLVCQYSGQLCLVCGDTFFPLGSHTPDHCPLEKKPCLNCGDLVEAVRSEQHAAQCPAIVHPQRTCFFPGCNMRMTDNGISHFDEYPFHATVQSMVTCADQLKLAQLSISPCVCVCCGKFLSRNCPSCAHWRYMPNLEIDGGQFVVEFALRSSAVDDMGTFNLNMGIRIVRKTNDAPSYTIAVIDGVVTEALVFRESGQGAQGQRLISINTERPPTWFPHSSETAERTVNHEVKFSNCLFINSIVITVTVGVFRPGPGDREGCLSHKTKMVHVTEPSGDRSGQWRLKKI